MREWVRNTMLLGVLLVGAGGGVLACGGLGSLQDYDHQKTLNGADVKALAVNTSDVDVKIVPGDGEQITAHFYGHGRADAYQLQATSSGGEATVEIERPSGINSIGWFGARIELHLDVTVPHKMYERLQLDSSSGDVVLRNLQAKQFDIETSSGDLNAEQVQGDQFVFKTSSGDLTTQSVQAAKTVELHTSSGTIKSSDLKALQVQAETSSGDLSFNQVAGAVRATTSSGDIVLNMKELGKSVTLNTSSGSAEVTLPSSSSFDLQFTTGSGDFENDFPLQLSKDTKNDKQGRFGSGGATVNFESSSGDLSLRRG